MHLSKHNQMRNSTCVLGPLALLNAGAPPLSMAPARADGALAAYDSMEGIARPPGGLTNVQPGLPPPRSTSMDVEMGPVPGTAGRRIEELGLGGGGEGPAETQGMSRFLDALLGPIAEEMAHRSPDMVRMVCYVVQLLEVSTCKGVCLQHIVTHPKHASHASHLVLLPEHDPGHEPGTAKGQVYRELDEPKETQISSAAAQVQSLQALQYCCMAVCPDH